MPQGVTSGNPKHRLADGRAELCRSSCHLATTARYEHINPYGQYRFEVKKGVRVHGARVTVVQE